MAKYEAFIFDMNGTMVNDMHFHELAWHDVLVNQLKAPLTLEEVKQQLYGKSSEMFERVFGPGRFSPDEIENITEHKEIRYRKQFREHLRLIDGLEDFLDKAKSHKIALAIGTAAPVLNVDFVLDNLNLRHYFPTIVGPDDVAESKPNPEVFLLAARHLGISPDRCVVFEDAPKGIEAASRAGMSAVGVTSYHTSAELENKALLYTIGDYTDKRLLELF